MNPKPTCGMSSVDTLYVCMYCLQFKHPDPELPALNLRPQTSSTTPQKNGKKTDNTAELQEEENKKPKKYTLL